MFIHGQIILSISYLIIDSKVLEKFNGNHIEWPPYFDISSAPHWNCRLSKAQKCLNVVSVHSKAWAPRPDSLGGPRFAQWHDW